MLGDIVNCFGEIIAIFFPSLLILFLLLYAKRTLVFRKRTSGSEMILIYGNYFIFYKSERCLDDIFIYCCIKSISKEIYRWRNIKNFWLLRKIWTNDYG